MKQPVAETFYSGDDSERKTTNVSLELNVAHHKITPGMH